MWDKCEWPRNQSGLAARLARRVGIIQAQDECAEVNRRLAGNKALFRDSVEIAVPTLQDSGVVHEHELLRCGIRRHANATSDDTGGQRFALCEFDQDAPALQGTNAADDVFEFEGLIGSFHGKRKTGVSGGK